MRGFYDVYEVGLYLGMLLKRCLLIQNLTQSKKLI